MLVPADPHYEPSAAIQSRGRELVRSVTSVREREALAYELLTSLPRSHLAVMQRRLSALLCLDIIGLLPNEIALCIFSLLSPHDLASCALVCRKWRLLADDQLLWRDFCSSAGWEWRTPSANLFQRPSPDDADEGMGEEEQASDCISRLSLHDSRSAGLSTSSPSLRYSLPPSDANKLPSSKSPICPNLQPNFKLLYRTHVLLRHRICSGIYGLSYLQTNRTPGGHTSAIYCLQLYSEQGTGEQVLYTGSKDCSIREWGLSVRQRVRVVHRMHDSSVLSVHVRNGVLVSGGSDRRVVIWDLTTNRLVKILQDHNNAVLCVRFDENRLVSCSKDGTVRTYLLPDYRPHHVLSGHRAAVNAVAISPTFIVSASGDRSIRLWDAESGTLLRTFEGHGRRGIASIDFEPPYILSGSSDKHLRLLDIFASSSYLTTHELLDTLPHSPNCGRTNGFGIINTPSINQNPRSYGLPSAHADFVRSVSMGSEFVISGSYDRTVKVWHRETGVLVANLKGGHTGRIFCVGFDGTKVVSCGEDQNICVWDFSHDLDTSFLKL